MNKILLSLMAGILIGVLIAPDKGSETLRKVRSRLDDYKDRVTDEADDWAGKGKDVLDKGRSKLKEALD